MSYMTYEMHLRDAHKEGKIEAMLDNVRALMASLHCDAQRAMELLKIPMDVQKKILVQI